MSGAREKPFDEFGHRAGAKARAAVTFRISKAGPGPLEAEADRPGRVAQVDIGPKALGGLVRRVEAPPDMLVAGGRIPDHRKAQAAHVEGAAPAPGGREQFARELRSAVRVRRPAGMILVRGQVGGGTIVSAQARPSADWLDARTKARMPASAAAKSAAPAVSQFSPQTCAGVPAAGVGSAARCTTACQPSSAAFSEFAAAEIENAPHHRTLGGAVVRVGPVDADDGAAGREKLGADRPSEPPAGPGHGDPHAYRPPVTSTRAAVTNDAPSERRKSTTSDTS